MPYFMGDKRYLTKLHSSLPSLHPHLPIGEVHCPLQSPIHQVTYWCGRETKVENHLHRLHGLWHAQEFPGFPEVVSACKTSTAFQSSLHLASVPAPGTAREAMVLPTAIIWSCQSLLGRDSSPTGRRHCSGS